ncbi:PhoPQ-activated protein PqaA family protein [Thiorhodococcus minor]|uniref:PhoPQ-activated pathogenicity n=1 Tax=Thiorhodococcus minor TaxID=57489 RepID=A0A6M0JZR7_9GAMM|nr:PhoPQ-activated protein PqaA family protein [Thiorhodococcus minor]NEV62629.1 hypothetical protein [Thiorhodococcus minor]
MTKGWICALALLLPAVLLPPQAMAETTALDDYVAKADPSYGYGHSATRHGWGYSVHVVDMTSQQWRSSAEVDRVAWTHEVLIAVPWAFHSGNQNTAILIVNGGHNGGAAGTENDELMGVLASATGSVVAMISQVPNQPLQFADEAAPREEDAILAYGMDKYLLTGDPEWLAQLPMTKAVIRALDTVQTFSATYPEILPRLPRIDDAVVLGGSKRGWTTWLTAAVESRKGPGSRVRAIIPPSIDLLNIAEQFTHHWEAYGFYSDAVQDYVAFDLPCRARTPEARAMLEIIDPYAYRDRYTMPKLVLNSAGDQFFLPDSSRFYWRGLPGPKHLRYSLNTDHAQDQDLTGIILPTLSWLSDVLDDKASPQIDWSFAPDGSIHVWTDRPPQGVRLWQATNPRARDFRLETIGAAWTSSQLEPGPDGTYVGYVPPPPEGWTAFTVEVTFPGSTLIPTPLESDQVFATGIRVTPDLLPYEGTSCPDDADVPIWPSDGPAAVDHRWSFIEAASGFPEAVVIAGPPSYRGSHPGVARLQHVGPSGFELRFQEWDYLARDFGDRDHALEEIPFLVLQSGRHMLSDGSLWEAGTFRLGGAQAWSAVPFTGPFADPPALFLTVQTTNGGQAVSARARNVTATGFEAALFEEEALNDGHNDEIVGYLAIHSPSGSGLLELHDQRVPYLLQRLVGDERWTPVLSQRLKVEEETSRDSEVDHADERLHVLALGTELFAQQVSSEGADTTAIRRLEPTADAPLEWGLLRDVDRSWQVLPFAKRYTDPVVVAQPVSRASAEPGVIRLTNIGADAAWLRFQTWDDRDSPTAPEGVFYMVAEATRPTVGAHRLGGLTVEAHQLSTDALAPSSQWEGVTFSANLAPDGLTAPALLTSVMAYNDSAPVTTRVDNLSPWGFDLAMSEKTTDSVAHLPERLGWIALQTGRGLTREGRQIDVLFRTLDQTPTSVVYPRPTSHRHPSILGAVDSSVDLDPVFLRYANPSDTQIELELSVEGAGGGDGFHAPEDVGIFVGE